MRRQRSFAAALAVVLVAGVTACALPDAARRSSDATSSGIGYEAEASLPFYDGILAFGTDGHLVDHDMDVSNPKNSAFFVRNFNNVDRDRYSLFGEWDRSLGDHWNLELGIRYSLVRMDAGRVDARPARKRTSTCT